MKRTLLVVFVAFAVLAGPRLWAHHSHASTYYQGETMRIEGQVAQVSIRNPHSWVHVNVQNSSGEQLLWAVEWGGANQLRRGDVTPRTLRVGDEVSVIGNPPRDPNQKRMRMVIIERPFDGWTWGRRPGEVVD